MVGIYGRYDWEDRSTQERELFMGFLRTSSSASATSTTRSCTRNASPMARIRSDAPLFFIVHGSNDSLIPVDQARAFVERLRVVSSSVVGYLELPGTGHGFDMLDGSRTASTAKAIAMFLNQVHRDRLQNKTKKIM